MNYKLRVAAGIIILLQLFSCSAGMDCLDSAGTAVSYEMTVAEFTSINISEGIELVITEGPERKVVVETGENLQGTITAVAEGGTLSISNTGSCNWARDYNTTRVYVTTPHLEKIYSASQFAVRSDGILRFPTLVIQSGLSAETASGTFELEVDCGNLIVEDNQSAYYHITGAAENLTVNFYSGDARFDGSSLIAEKVNVFHRSSNDIIVNPQQEVKGTIYSTGNLVLKHLPPVVEVEELYTGAVIF